MPDPANPEPSVVIVGAGPVGMLLALRLAQLGVPSLLAEQNEETINYPKMDVTNIRSMEILRFMGPAEEYRQLGPEESTDWITPFTTGMGEGGHHLFSWQLEGNKTWRNRIMTLNDGSQPIEPPLRSSQIVLEGFLKKKVLITSLIRSKFGWRFESCDEDATGVTSIFISADGAQNAIRSRYLVGSDGGRSTVRTHLGIQTTGYNFPAKMFMTYIRSDELAARRHFGHYWHIVTPKGFLIDTNARNLFASHHMFLENDDTSNLDPFEVTYANLGGIGPPWRFKIDELLGHSVWQPRFRCASMLSTPSKKIHLVGDAAHAVPPHGGHSLNTGILGMWNLSWKLASVVKGYAGDSLLQSYDTEMRPVAMGIIEAVGGHISRQTSYSTVVAENLDVIDKETPEGETVRAQVGAMIRDIGNHGKYFGRELDQRYQSEIIITDAGDSEEPSWNPLQYTPSTWPGARAPHVWLKDGPTAMFDHYGLWWTLITFQKATKKDDVVVKDFGKVAERIGMPLKIVELIDEDHARRIWERDLVLVRPDGHVAWRSDEAPSSAQIGEILDIVSGRDHPSSV